jgi:hypothetical protein
MVTPIGTALPRAGEVCRASQISMEIQSVAAGVLCTSTNGVPAKWSYDPAAKLIGCPGARRAIP